MARKKKSADARGYSQGGGGPQQSSNNNATTNNNKSKAPSVSTKTHNEMKDLLGQFDGNNHNGVSETMTTTNNTSSSTVRPSDRFISRLSNIIDRLDELGFTPTQVEHAVKALGYEITLETALDWLCLNLNTLELPALFTDGDLRQDLSTVTTVDSLTVLQESAPVSDGGDNDNNILAVVIDDDKGGKLDETGSNHREDELEKQREDERKKMLLQQYEYEEEDGEIEDNEVSPPNKDEETTQEEKEDEQQQQQHTLTPDEQRLAEEEKALAELQADANDDANNYMRSKAEIKQLQGQVKKMKQKVAGLRKKVERNRAQERRQREEEKKEEVGNIGAVLDDGKEEKESQECDNGGLFDMFAKDDEDNEKEAVSVTATEEKKSIKDAPKILNFTIPQSWTGSTPQKKLEEVLKKRKVPRAKYTKLPMNGGFNLSISLNKKQPAQKWQAKAVDFQKGSSLKDYLAVQALYSMDPTLPLYQIFPPNFRDLWLSWMNEVKAERDEVQRVQDDAKQQRVDHLMMLISEMQVGRTNNGATEKKRSGDGHGNNETDIPNNGDVIMDDWDDASDADDDILVKSNTTRSAKGQKMQTDFVRRRSTPPYQKMKGIRESLPMASYRSDILETLTNNPVTILCAETGAGKSTQCAQYILEQALLDGHGDAVNIICTQPRRVAATSLAERVSDEMCENLGKMVGYQIRMESKRSAQTKLLFCTTGVILRRLQDDPTLTGITHVIVDEVHERQQQIDVLLIILRQLLQTTRPDLKVVLMSATMETDLFRSFFHGAPMISVPGRTFPVSSYYLEDLLDATDHIIDEGSRYALRDYQYAETASLMVTTRGGEKRKEMVDLSSQVELGGVSSLYAGYKMSTRRSMERANEKIINYDLIEDVLKLFMGETDGNHILVAPDGADMSKGSILIFLPGLGEIRALTERLEGSRLFRDRKRFDLIPLHSTLSSRDQRRAFLPSKPGCRKIICATNIAETSVTIPDVVCVIDSGLVREIRQNKKTKSSMLVTDFCPQSSAKQRQGRAGRVQSGICLKLYSSATAERVMQATNEPELRRVPLQEVCMSILASGFAKNCMEFLDQAPQPPSKESVQAAMDVLYDVGAIESQGDTIQQIDRLTPLGLHLAKLPVDVKLGKMLICGALFRCIDPILTIAASLSSKSPFSAFTKDAAIAKAKQRVFADPDSDFMTYCNVWDAYIEAAETSASAGRRFCQENYLNYAALSEIGDARRQFLDLLCGIGFLDRNMATRNGSRIDSKRLKSCHFNRHAKKPEVVHAVICAGLYPNVARLEQSKSLNYSMMHKEERIYFHKDSIHATKKRFLSSESWVIFHEKFGTPSRTSVSTTAFVHPFALLLFGGSVEVKHRERMVVIDDWMSIGMSAQTGVILRELRNRMGILLQRMIERADSNEKLDSSMIEGIINILHS